MSYPTLLAQTNNASDVVAGGFSLVIGILGLIVGVLWIIFPFMVYSKFGSLERLQRRQNTLLEQIAKNTRPASESAKISSSVGYTSLPQPKASLGPILGVFGVLAFIVFVIFLATRK